MDVERACGKRGNSGFRAAQAGEKHTRCACSAGFTPGNTGINISVDAHTRLLTHENKLRTRKTMKFLSQAAYTIIYKFRSLY